MDSRSVPGAAVDLPRPVVMDAGIPEIRPASEIVAPMKPNPCLRVDEGAEPMMNEMMDRVDERIVEHVDMAFKVGDDIHEGQSYGGGSTLRAMIEEAISYFNLEALIAPPLEDEYEDEDDWTVPIWGGGRLLASINDVGGRGEISFFVCPNCLEPDRPAIPLHQWMTALAGSSAPAHRCR